MEGSEIVVSETASARARVSFTTFRSPDDPMLQSWMRFRSMLTAGFAHPGSEYSAPHRPLAVPSRRAEATAGSTTGTTHADPSQNAPRPGFWRLLASNNREVARSFLLYDGFGRAQSHVHQLQLNSRALSVAIVRVQSNGARGWVITYGDAPVAMCSRWYDSVSTGIAAAEGALAALPRASLAMAPDRSMASGRFQRRGTVGGDAVSRDAVSRRAAAQ